MGERWREGDAELEGPQRTTAPASSGQKGLPGQVSATPHRELWVEKVSSTSALRQALPWAPLGTLTDLLGTLWSLWGISASVNCSLTAAQVKGREQAVGRLSQILGFGGALQVFLILTSPECLCLLCNGALMET